jgi:hypothetical protein
MPIKLEDLPEIARLARVRDGILSDLEKIKVIPETLSDGVITVNTAPGKALQFAPSAAAAAGTYYIEGSVHRHLVRDVWEPAIKAALTRTEKRLRELHVEFRDGERLRPPHPMDT